MENWKKAILTPSNTILEAMKLLNESASGLVIVSKDKKLVGVVADGDVRRAILNNMPLTAQVSQMMNKTPMLAYEEDSRETILKKFKEKVVSRIPLVNKDLLVLDILALEKYIEKVSQPEAHIVIMAGGLGSRLKPLTDLTPKPMLKVGGKPILENIIAGCIDQGFKKFSISVNYKKEIIKDYFGDGAKWDVEIDYLEEDKKLGTAGALSLLSPSIDKPIIVMNGDILTKVDFNKVLNFHTENSAQATMCLKEYDFQVPYGVVKMSGIKVSRVDEKPVQKFLVNAGIYVLSTNVLKYIPSDESYNMTNLFDDLKKNNEEVIGFPIHEYWIDIGREKDFERAQSEVKDC
ncbi:nucleotidyltransferase family protein [Halobacteriovorax sp. HLS]|uniref:nucleotidyltransferase family protein n=1 Tax=Halobacteriovorax sp. HLS TaxID=2234000 RepID=UPI000FD948EC|nr:nucleotidyltransferase family protein [Halobacteriovorax sp. HLS]